MWVYGYCKDILKPLIMDTMRSLGHDYGRSGVGWWEFSHNLPPTSSTNGYLFSLFFFKESMIKVFVFSEINTFFWCFFSPVFQCVILWHYEYLLYCLVSFSGITAWKIVIFSGWLMIDVLLTIISKKWLKPAE